MSRKRSRDEATMHVVANVDRARMYPQPKEKGRMNGCWVSPVVAAARHYGFADATPDSVLKFTGEEDRDESAAYVLWRQFGIGTQKCLDEKGWNAGDDRDIWINGCEEDYKILDAGENTHNSGMFFERGGEQHVSEAWFEAVMACINSNNLALLLGQRLEEGERKAHAKATGSSGPATHYLLLCGYKRESGRRGIQRYTLIVKDSMDDTPNRAMEARLEAGRDAGVSHEHSNKMVLKTTQANGTACLDRFLLLECYFIRGKTEVPPSDDGELSAIFNDSECR